MRFDDRHVKSVETSLAARSRFLMWHGFLRHSGEFPLENLTMPGKWAVIKAILCDRQTKTVPTLFPANPEPNSGGKTGKILRIRGRNSGLAFAALMFFLLSIGFCINGLSQGAPTEYQIKAAFLFNFAKFVDWPPEAFRYTNSPIVVGVLGKNVFGTTLQATIRDKTVNNRFFQFREFTSATEATNCQILFISSSEKDNFAKIVTGLHNASILTVSEADGFIKAGGMINFIIEDSKVRFQISEAAAKKAGLKVSSKLLSLAVPIQ
jgi:hypothetical protein